MTAARTALFLVLLTGCATGTPPQPIQSSVAVDSDPKLERSLSRYLSERDGQRRADLLKQLAPSQDPRAAVLLGEALDDEDVRVRLAAAYGLLDNFMPHPIAGGTEQHIDAARAFWQATGPQYREAAAAAVRNLPVIVRVTPAAPAFTEGEPIALDLTIENHSHRPISFPGFGDNPTPWNAEASNISLVDIYRDGEMSNLYLQRPTVTPPMTISGQGGRSIPPGCSYTRRFDASKWTIRGGWAPGTYEITARADSVRLDPFATARVLSLTAHFEITPR
jgi:hypothetical protein